MTKIDKINSIVNELKESFNNNTFVKISLANYKGSEPDLKKLFTKKIRIKDEEKLSFTYRYKTRDIVKNYSFNEGLEIIANYLQTGFNAATLFTIKADFIYENFNDKKFVFRQSKASITKLPSLEHDRKKERKITVSDDKKYLYLLDITDANGKVLAKSQNKYKQLNHYIEILSSMLSNLKTDSGLKIVDMGSGKGYLTFALYDYLTNQLKLKADITGVEFRPELVELCNKIAIESGYSNLNFVEGEIQNFAIEKTHIIIALHACDTATDDAIAKGINTNAQLIVTAPCCQHQIRKQMEQTNAENLLSPIIKHGIFLERQAELLTDGIRALVLEYFGYKTKVVEFIADAHTHKNVMIIAEKSNQKVDKVNILKQINKLKTEFGISFFELEKMLK
ncbi:MAG: SAM-dependent methyltransferase [Bacteroidales bacterium]|nr:SAM-dependent methyltransferase [Bacteroidales bacterium]MDD4217128.1 SAM-dependent methyltransferase [Bacteroidales bacterium]MDY0142382.1 SAM-dependent methyltransferase [Bacteroidales bacterium]